MRTQDAKTIAIGNLLSALGHAPVKVVSGEKWYISPFRQERTESFKLSADERGWYDHGLGRGGNILDLVMLLNNCALGDALREIERLVGSPSLRASAAGQGSLFKRFQSDREAGLPELPFPSKNAPTASQEATRERSGGFTEVTIKAVTDGRLLRYLQQRAIPPALAREYVQEIRYSYNEKRYFALAFPNDYGSYEMKNQYYTGVYGKKAISTLRAPQAWVPSVALFEGMFDFFSALVWDASAIDGAVIVLNSVAMKAQAVAALRRMDTRTVKLYLDNDNAGKTLARELQEELTDYEVRDCSGAYAGYKDFNDFLQAQQRQGGAKKSGMLV